MSQTIVSRDFGEDCCSVSDPGVSKLDDNDPCGALPEFKCTGMSCDYSLLRYFKTADSTLVYCSSGALYGENESLGVGCAPIEGDQRFTGRCAASSHHMHAHSVLGRSGRLVAALRHLPAGLAHLRAHPAVNAKFCRSCSWTGLSGHWNGKLCYRQWRCCQVCLRAVLPDMCR